MSEDDFREKVIIPEWGKYGVRIELKPPNEQFKNPKLLISEVHKSPTAKDGWKFYMRNFNDQQKARGYYNAHCSVPVDSIAPLIEALVEVWKATRKEDEVVSDEALEIAHRVKHTEKEDTLFRESKELAELHDPADPAPAKKGDPWDMVRRKVGDPEMPDENMGNSDDPDDHIPF